MKRRHFLGYSLLFLAGCTTTAQVENTSSTSNDLPSKLRFTITDIQSLAQLEQDYGALRTTLSEVLDTELEFVPFDSYTAAAAALQLNQLDFALTGPSEYVVIRARTNAVPVIGITRPGYYALLCTKAGNGIASVADLKGKKLTLWKVGSTSGHLGPTKLVMDAGLNPQTDLEVVMLAEAGLPGLMQGDVEAWGGSAVKYHNFLKDEGLTEADLPILSQGPMLPNDVFVASSKLQPDAITAIRDRMIQHQSQILQSLLTVEEGKFEGSELIAANDADYDMVRDVYKAIGQDKFIQ